MQRPERRELVTHGQRLGRYRVRGALGQRGDGRLYVAEQTGEAGTEIVALKHFLPHVAHTPQFRTMFLKGSQVAAQLAHTNIVTTYEMGEVEGTYFIAMEYLPGEDLATILARRDAGPMPVEIAAALAEQALRGLHHAHALLDGEGRPLGVVRRGINPSNIFVTYDGIVKLLDFGLVKESGNSETTPGVLKGKTGYCAPEQLGGGPVDLLADVFCVGIILWECLTGRRLFAGWSEGAVMDAVRRQRIVSPSTWRREVTPELDRITMLALRDDRSLRYQSAEEMARVLDLYLARVRRRPTPASIGQWMQQLFGIERCLLKKAIAEGAQVETALARLAAATLDGVAEAPTPRAQPTTREIAGTVPASEQSDDVTSRFEVPVELAQKARLPLQSQATPAVVEDLTPTPVDRHEGRAMTITAIVGVVAVAVFVAVMLRDAEDPAPTAAPGTTAAGTLQLETDPPGAQVFLDGNPVGSTTPLTIRGLRPGRSVEIRLEKPGYRPSVRRLEVGSGQSPVHSLSLAAVAGIVRFEGLPAAALIYVDDVLADARSPLTVPLGPHRVRVELKGEILFSRSVEVRPGEQIVQVKEGGRGR